MSVEQMVVSTHSRPKAAGKFILSTREKSNVSTHSRPKAAGFIYKRFDIKIRFQHTAARRRLGMLKLQRKMQTLFQHTAARRRLVSARWKLVEGTGVSTHSRPKAAGDANFVFDEHLQRFNTQPPEGGWGQIDFGGGKRRVSTHSRPKAAGIKSAMWRPVVLVSTHSRPKAAGYHHG